MKKHSWVIVSLVCLCVLGLASGAGKGSKGKGRKEKAEKKKELTLKELMPEKSFFGPSASSMAFSQDGKYGAYRYRPYKERRHGSDLYIYNIEEGRADRVTWPSVMAKFQKGARKVVEDRIKKAKKASDRDKSDGEKAKGKKRRGKKVKSDQEDQDADDDQDTEKEGQAEEDESEDASKDEDADKEEDADESEKGDEKELDEKTLKERGDWVGEKDADDEKAPRYRGIGWFAWSPVATEILFEGEGDVYRYTVDGGQLTRLTQTRQRESSIAWLPDGKGYTFRREGGLFRRLFEGDLTRQLDPKFPDDDHLERYRLSPDGKHITFVTSKRIKEPTTSKVEIANYRNRLMKAREVSRHVSDDSLPTYRRRVYLYEISDEQDEKDTLTEVLQFETRMPDDMLKAPVWSPDSKKIAFLTFEQDPALVKIYEARVREEEGKEDEDEKVEEGDEEESDSDDEKGDKKEDKKKEKDEDKEEAAEKAKEIYRFMHYGGPNTPRMMQLYYLADNKRLVYLSEQTGFRHLHLLDPLYESFQPLTSGPYEVYPIDISKDRQWVFVRATKEHPSQTDVYKVSTASGRMIRLTKETGMHTDAAVSQDGMKVLTNLVSYEKLRELVFIDRDADVYKTLTDSHPEKAHKFAEPTPEFFDYQNRHGHKLYGMMFKPDKWSKDDKRPVLIYFYGGPLGTTKMVAQGSFSPYNYAFPYYMAKKHGYVTCTIDTRGNSGYAGVFEKANFGQVGKPQVEDLVDAVGFLVENYGVDKKKVAIHGWSFGGFQTQMCMYTEPDVFQVGIAGAGPTEWENYNSWYTRHTIGKSEPGKATLKEFSLLPLAKNLKGHLLLVHGMEDSNVLYQDTVRVYRELLKAGKETLVELFLDPTGGHGLGGDVKTLSRYRKYEQFLLRTIGEYKAKSDKRRKRKSRDKKEEQSPNANVLASKH